MLAKIVSSLAFVAAAAALSLSARAGTFTNALNSQRGADPCLRFVNNKFFLTSTQNTNIQMRSATTIEGLKTATPTVVFTDTTAGRNFDFWAPEFWYLNGRWYIYYAVAGDEDDNTHRLHVLSGPRDATNPLAGPYTHVGPLVPSNFDKWAVDASILTLNSTNYLIFSGKTDDAVWTQCTYIAPMSSPTALSGPAVQISCPTLSWETAATPVQEGPEALTINGTTHIIYSASHCSTDDYALGRITLKTGSDPLVASNWVKAANPVFTKNVAAGVYGPGHHFMFMKGDEHYFVYHAKSAPGQGCGDLRTTRVQPFSLNGSVPVFPAAVATGVSVPEP